MPRANSGSIRFLSGSKSKSRPLLQLHQLPVIECKDGIHLRQFLRCKRTMPRDADVETAIAEPELRHEEHVPTVKRVVQECHFAAGTHARIDRAKLLDDVPAF